MQPLKGETPTRFSESVWDFVLGALMLAVLTRLGTAQGTEAIKPESLPTPVEWHAGINTPGTADYPNGGMRLHSRLDLVNECQLDTAVADPVNGYVYFMGSYFPGRIVKVALENDDAPPRRIGSIQLPDDEAFLRLGAIDPEGGHGFVVGSRKQAAYNPGDDTPKIIQFALGEGDALPRRVGSFTLPDPATQPQSLLVDPSRRFLFVLGRTHIFKYRLGGPDPLPAYVGSWTVPETYEIIRNALIDVQSGYLVLWVGESYPDPTSIEKIAIGGSDEAPYRVSLTSIGSRPGSLLSSGLDETRRVAYFQTGEEWIQVAVGEGESAPALVRVDSLQVNLRMQFDASAGYAYGIVDGTSTSVRKYSIGVDGTKPALIGTVSLDEDPVYTQSVAIDAIHGSLYVCRTPYRQGPSVVVKLRMGVESALPSRVGAVELVGGEWNLRGRSLDLAHGYGYFTTSNRLLKVDLGAANESPRRAGALDLSALESRYFTPWGFLCDLPGRFGYLLHEFPTSGSKVTKFALGNGDSLPVKIGETLLEGYCNYQSSCGFWPLSNAQGLENSRNYGYYTNEYGQIAKVDLEMGDMPPHQVSLYGPPPPTPTMCPTDCYWTGGPITPTLTRSPTLTPTPTATLMPSVTVTPSATLVGLPVAKLEGISAAAVPTPLPPDGSESESVPLAEEPTASCATAAPNPLAESIQTDPSELPPAITPSPTRDCPYWKPGESPVSAPGLQIDGVYNTLFNAAYIQVLVDEGTRTGLFLSDSAGTFYSGVMKFDLGAGDSAPIPLSGLLDSNHQWGYIYCGIFDSVYHRLLLAVGYGDVIKIDPGQGDDPMREVPNTHLSPKGEERFIDGDIDDQAGIAWFVDRRSQIAKVSVGEADEAPKLAALIKVADWDLNPGRLLVDKATGFAYMAGNGYGVIAKFSLSQISQIKATRIVVPWPGGTVREARFYSHAAKGKVRLALYDDGPTTHSLLWEAGPTTNTAANDWFAVPVSEGSPASLDLAPGVYWLAWQTDSNADVPSYVPSQPGDGFRLWHDFGPFPDAIAPGDKESTNETWSGYLTFTPAVAIPSGWLIE